MVGDEFRVNSAGAGVPSPAVAGTPGGDFVIAWGQGTRDAIAVQRYDASGVPDGREFRVNTNAVGMKSSPALAINEAGNCVFTWTSFGQDGSECGVYAQRYAPILSPASVGGRVWDDAKYNGIRDAGEPGIDGVTVTVYTELGLPLESTTTSGGGLYRFDGLRPGVAHYVQFTSLSGKLFTTAHQGTDDAMDSDADMQTGKTALFALAENQVDLNWSAGLTTAGSLSGTVYHDLNADGRRDAGEPPLAGWTVFLDSNGNGQVDAGEPSATTVANGSYIFTNVRPGSFQVAEVPVLYWTLTTPASVLSSVVVAPGQAVSGVDLGNSSATVGGRVWEDLSANGIQDADEPGRNGLTVTLYSEDGVAVRTAVTSASGLFRFDALCPGVPLYLQFIAPIGRSFTAPDREADDTLDSDVAIETGKTPLFTLASNQVDLNWGAGLIQPEAILGIVFFDADRSGTQDAGEPGLPGWIAFVDADGDGQLDPNEPFSPGSADKGQYRIDGIQPGPLTIALLPQDHWTVPQSKTVNVAPWQVLSGVDFGCYTDVPNTLTNPAGGEFGVNTTTLGSQRNGAVASDSNGNVAVVWESDGQDGDALGIYAQRYNAAGQRLGSEFRVNTSTAGSQSAPVVAMDADGDFVVVWQSTTAQGNGNGVYAQRYDAAGQPQGPEFPVATFTKEDLWLPSVAMDHDGDFVVTWQSHGAGTLSVVWVRQFDLNGTAMGDARPVTTASGVDQSSSAVAMDAAVDFVVAWTQAGSQGGIYAQRLNLTGGLQGDAFRVTTDQVAPVLAMNSSGEFLVSWEGPQIWVQRYNQAGSPQGNSLSLARSTSRVRHSPSVAMDDDGSFVVAWEYYFQNLDLYAQRFNGVGMPQGSSFIVNTYATSDQQRPAVAMDADGDFVIVWDSKNQDTNAEGIYARRYQVVRPPDPMIVARDYDTYLRRDGDTVLVLFPADHPTPALPIGLPAASFPLAALSGLWVNPASSPGRITVDPSGDPIPSGGLHIVSKIPNDSFCWVYVDLPSQVSTAPFAVYVHGKVTAGFQRSKTYGAIHLLDTSLARFGGAFAPVFRVGDLSIAPGARLDLQYADLIVQATPATREAVAAAVFGHVKSARNAPGGLWTGTGITHTGAATDTFKGLAVALNDRGNGTPWLTGLQGLPSDINDVVVMYTWNGDANLDGVVNADDYFQIDSNFIPQGKGYQNGDFNYDDVVNADDYFLIDSAFLGQTGPLPGGESASATTHAAPEPADSAAMGDAVIVQGAKKQEADSLLAELFSTEPVL